MLAEEGPAPAQRLGLALDVEDVVGQLAPALAGVHEQGADAPVDVDHGVGGGGPGPGRLLVEAVAALALGRSASRFRAAARWWKVSSRSPGPPTRRACSTMPATSSPVLDTRPTGSPVDASSTVVPSSVAVCQASRA